MNEKPKRPGRQVPRSPIVGIRLNQECIDDLDQLAEEADRKRSEVVRSLLDAALSSPAARKAAIDALESSPRNR